MDTKANEQSSFPHSIIKGVAKDFNHVHSILEVPPEFMYMAFMVCLGSLLGDRITIKTELRPQPRLYVLLLGESADDRKSTAIKKTTDFFRFALENISGWSFNNCWGTGSAEGLARILKSKSLDQEKKQLLVCYDEFNVFIAKAKIKSSALLPCVNSLFESNRYENQIKKTGIKIENGYLSLIAASTLQTYEATWDKSFTDIGFSNRLFIVPGTGERKDFLPPPIPLDDIRRLTAGVLSILDFVGNFREITIAESALEVLQEWYLNRPSSVHSKRLDGYALRVLILMAANKKQTSIDDQMAFDVIALMDWQLKMRKLHDPINADNACANMEEKIRRVLGTKKSLSERDLKNMTNARRTGLFIYNNAISNLRKAGEICSEKKGTVKKWRLV